MQPNTGCSIQRAAVIQLWIESCGLDWWNYIIHADEWTGEKEKNNPQLTVRNCNCNCNWGTCIAPPTRRPRAHHRVNPYPAARRQNETKMFSDHHETSPSIAAVSYTIAPSIKFYTVFRYKTDLSAVLYGYYNIKVMESSILPDWFHGLSGHLMIFYSAQRLDLLAWCVRLSRLLVGFRTHFKSLHFHSFVHFILSLSVP